jgi:hypothetical protein
MGSNSIRYDILLAVDSLFEGTAPGYNDAQMSAIINKAQRRVFHNLVKEFDRTEKVKKILSPVLRRASTVDSSIEEVADSGITDYAHTTSVLDSQFYRLPSDTAFVVEEYGILTKDNVATDPVIVLPVEYDYFLKNYNNRYKKPHVDLLWRLDFKLETVTDVNYYTSEIVYPNDYTLTSYHITYLKYPQDVTVDTGTPENAVDPEIIDRSFADLVVAESVKIITAALNDSDYNVAVAERNFDE